MVSDEPTTDVREDAANDPASPATPAEDPSDSPVDTPATRQAARSGRGRQITEWLAGAVPWPLAIVTGGTAYLAGYAATALVFFAGPASFGSIDRLGEQVKIVGFVFTNQHFVDVVVADSGGAVIQRGNIILAGDTSSLPPAVYFAIPVAVLLAAGFLFARTQYDATDGYAVAPLTGGGMALGYAGVGYLATFLFVRSDRFGNTASVDGTGVIAMGLLYALVFGTIGCLVALWGTRWAAGDAPSE